MYRYKRFIEALPTGAEMSMTARLSSICSHHLLMEPTQDTCSDIKTNLLYEISNIFKVWGVDDNIANQIEVQVECDKNNNVLILFWHPDEEVLDFFGNLKITESFVPMPDDYYISDYD